MPKTIFAISIGMLISIAAHAQEYVAPATNVSRTGQVLFQIRDQNQLKVALDQADTQLKRGNLNEAAKSISAAKQVMIQAENVNSTGGDANLGLPLLGETAPREVLGPGTLIAVKVLTCDSNEQLVIIGQRSAKCVRQP